MGEWCDSFGGYQERWVICPKCSGQGHWYNGVSITICPRCGNEGEVKEVRVKPKRETTNEST